MMIFFKMIISNLTMLDASRTSFNNEFFVVVWISEWIVILSSTYSRKLPTSVSLGVLYDKMLEFSGIVTLWNHAPCCLIFSQCSFQHLSDRQHLWSKIWIIGNMKLGGSMIIWEQYQHVYLYFYSFGICKYSIHYRICV